MSQRTNTKVESEIQLALTKSKDLPATIGLVLAVRDELKSEMETRFNQMQAQIDRRFAEVDAQFIKIDARLTEIDARFTEVHAKIDTLIDKFEDFQNRIYHAIKVQETRNWQQSSENKFVLDRYNICVEKIMRLEEKILHI